MTIYQLPDLSYDYGALEPHLSARILELHHGKHHRSFVDGTNTTLEKLATARETADFASIVGEAIGVHFGGFAAFKAQMAQATVSVQGSGWSVLAWEHAYYLQYEKL